MEVYNRHYEIEHKALIGRTISWLYLSWVREHSIGETIGGQKGILRQILLQHCIGIGANGLVGTQSNKQRGIQALFGVLRLHMSAYRFFYGLDLGFDFILFDFDKGASGMGRVMAMKAHCLGHDHAQ